MIKFAIFCTADTIADYVKHPQVELAHRLLALEHEQAFVDWRREHGRRARALLDEPQIGISAHGKLTVAGLAGEEWERARHTPPAGAVEFVAGFEGNVARLFPRGCQRRDGQAAERDAIRGRCRSPAGVTNQSSMALIAVSSIGSWASMP